MLVQKLHFQEDKIPELLCRKFLTKEDLERKCRSSLLYIFSFWNHVLKWSCHKFIVCTIPLSLLLILLRTRKLKLFSHTQLSRWRIRIHWNNEWIFISKSLSLPLHLEIFNNNPYFEWISCRNSLAWLHQVIDNIQWYNRQWVYLLRIWNYFYM